MEQWDRVPRLLPHLKPIPERLSMLPPLLERLHILARPHRRPPIPVNLCLLPPLPPLPLPALPALAAEWGAWGSLQWEVQLA